MRKLLAAFGVLLLATACQHAAPAGDDASTQNLTGEDAYRLACARCHDEGRNGAPAITDASAWAGRSWLWEAVLFEHVRNGFGNMPAKGGFETLDDTSAERAAEYMMRRVHPTTSPD